MRKISVIIIILLTCSGIAAVPINIFHTNDTHGVYVPRIIKSGERTSQLGGYATLEHFLNLERQKAPRSLYLDAGDQQTGSIFSALKHNGAVGGRVIEVFNSLALDASTFGNHEFDLSYANTLKLVQLADYPFISSNLQDKDARAFGGTPYKIFTLDSLRVGVLGLTLEELPEKVKRENVRDITILPYKQAIDKYLDEVDKQSDLIVILSHLGQPADSLLAMGLDDRIDLIIGGHSHVQIDKPWLVNGIYITSAGSHTEFLGKLELDVTNDRITSYKSTLIPMWTPEIMAQTALGSHLQSIADSLDTEMGKTIAILPKDWIPDKFAETAVSRWMAEALLAEYNEDYQADLALLNCGGFRKKLSKGPITLKDMHEMLPFGNYVVLFSCYGRDLLNLDGINQKHALDKPYDIIQSSAEGWKSKRSCFGLGKPRSAYYINGKKLDPDKIYRVVSHDYVAGQWDKYLGFEPFDVQETGELILDASLRQVIKQYGLKN